MFADFGKTRFGNESDVYDWDQDEDEANIDWYAGYGSDTEVEKLNVEEES
jgi:hypothetical protein